MPLHSCLVSFVRKNNCNVHGSEDLSIALFHDYVFKYHLFSLTCVHTRTNTNSFSLVHVRAYTHAQTIFLSLPHFTPLPPIHPFLPPSLTSFLSPSLPLFLSLSLSLAHALAFAHSLPCTKHACLHSISPTHTAVQNGHIETAKFLLSKGADVNLTDIWSTSVSFICIYVERGFYTLHQGVIPLFNTGA